MAQLLGKQTFHCALRRVFTQLGDCEQKGLLTTRAPNEMNRFDETPTGTFHNLDRIQLVWCEPDWFEYLPDKTEPFSYSSSDGLEVVPGRFYFDGGSTPLYMRIFPKYSPWYYTPVALVHDWLAEMQACRKPLVDFDSAVRIQQEALKTMMLMDRKWQSVTIFNLSRKALRSRKARRIWDVQEDQCPVPISRKKQRLKL